MVTPSTISLSLADDTGVSATDHITNDATFNVTGAPDGRVDLVFENAQGMPLFPFSAQLGDDGTLSVPSGVLRDGHYILAATEFPNPSSSVTVSEGFTLDRTAPSANASSGIAHATNATTVTETVTFSEAVAGVLPSSFTVTGTGTASGYVSSTAEVGTDGKTYAVTLYGLSGDGAVSLGLATGNGITDIAGNPASSLSGLPLTLDHTAPTATASSGVTGTTNATTVTETVTFSEAVAGVTADAFTLFTTGTASAHIASVTAVGTGGTTYAVTLDDVSGDGTLHLNLMAPPNGTIADIAGNAARSLTGGGIVVDHTAPTASIATGVTGATAASSVVETVTFSEAVTGVAAGSFALTTTGTASAHIQSVTQDGPDGTTYAVTLDGLTGTGNVHLGLAQNPGVTDVAGNVAVTVTGGDLSIAHSVQAPASYDLGSFVPGQQSSFTGQNALTIAGLPSDVTVTPGNGGVTLGFAGQAYTFADGTLSTASQAGHVSFSDGTQLLVGTDGGNDMLSGLDDSNHLVYGFGGDDDINVGDGNNVVNGGLGSDTIYAYAGNNHIWGNASGTAGQADGADHIVINGGGSNYVNGNAGDDYIEVGTGGSTGANRLYGGAGQDTIILHGAGANSVNGNMGQDTIDASDATGNNLLRGGQGDDVIHAGHGRDQLMGDIGNDTLVAGTGAGHLTIMTGGVGADTFDFSHGAQSQVTVAGTTYQSSVTDFNHSTDHIGLAFALGSGDLLTASTTFSDVASAQAYAQSLLSAHAGTTNVAALQVGGDTVLFYDTAGTSATIDSVVRLSTVNASMLTTSDFAMIGA